MVLRCEIIENTFDLRGPSLLSDKHLGVTKIPVLAPRKV